MASLLKTCTAWDTISDWKYGDDSPNQVLDLYVPRDNKGSDGKQWLSNPLIIWVHGGGWIGGDENPGGMPPGYQALIKRGFAIASIRYRLSTEAIWPAQIVDVLAATRELRARAPQWRIYSFKFGGWGVSAGAHLIALAASVAPGTDFLEGNWDDTLDNLTVGCCDAPPTNFSTWVNTAGYQTFDDPGQFINTLFGGTVADNLAVATAASPALRVTPASAPLLVRHGTLDDVVPFHQSEELQTAYTNAGIGPSTGKFYLQPFVGDKHGGPTWYDTTHVKAVGDMFSGWLVS